MQLICNGVVLDLMAGTTISFKKSNQLFAFDNISCERSLSFDLPDTANNEKVLGLAKMAAFSGVGMRYKWGAELHDGVIVKKGYVYVDSYSKGKYKAIFVTGELFGLQKIKDLGNLQQALGGTATDMAIYGVTPIRPQVNYPFGTVRYKNVQEQTIMLSIDVRSILAWLTVRSGVQFLRSLPEDVGSQRIVLPSLNPLPDEYAEFTAVHEESAGSDEGYNRPAMRHDIVLRGQISSEYETLISANAISQEWINGEGVKLYGYPIQFTNLTTLAITFPDTFPSNYYLIEEPVNQYINFLGGYSFVKTSGGTVTRYGTPLAARTITLPRGQKWMIVTDEHYNTSPYDSTKVVWKFTSDLRPQLLVLNGGDEVTEGDTITVSNNLPTCSVIEFLHAIAATTGRVLNYTDAEGVQFDNVALDDFGIIDITGKVVEVDKLERCFGDYAQNNIIKTVQSEWVKYFVTGKYTIINENIDKEKTLLDIPFSEARSANRFGDLQIQYPYTDEFEREVAGEENFVLANYYQYGKEHVDPAWPKDPDEWTDEMWEQYFNWRNTSDDLMQIRFPLNAGIRALCAASTGVKVKVRMSLQEYESINAHTAVLLDGTRYVWTEANWSKGTATLNLSKIE